MDSLSILDIVIIVVGIALSLFSCVKGLFKNLISFILMIVAIVVAGVFAQKLQVNFVNSIISDNRYAYIVSFLMILGCSYLIIFGIMKTFMSKNKEKDGFANIILSFFIALIRYSFIFAIALATVASIPNVESYDVWKESKLAIGLATVGDYAYTAKTIKIKDVNIKDYTPPDQESSDSSQSSTNTSKAGNVPSNVAG